MRMSATGNSRGDAGFTLVELLVTLTIVAFVATAAAALLPSGGGSAAALQAAAQTLAADLRAARGRAIAEGRSIRMALDREGGRYGMADRGPRPLPGGVALAESAPAEIVFQRDGTTAGGVIALEAQDRTQIRRATVQVERLSGRVHVVGRP
jgi:general secretion pathway protein H